MDIMCSVNPEYKNMRSKKLIEGYVLESDTCNLWLHRIRGPVV